MFRPTTALAILVLALTGCARSAVVEHRTDGGGGSGGTDGGVGGGGGSDGGSCLAPGEGYYVGDPETCARIRYACTTGHEPFSDECGCGCTCPGKDDPRVTYMGDPKACETIDFDCGPGSTAFDSECGCGCIMNEPSCAGEPSPVACAPGSCERGYFCDTTRGCSPSSCTCTASGWACTKDCVTGLCVPQADTCNGTLNPAGCVETGCPTGQVCDTSQACNPSSCFCDPATGGWACTDDCAGGLCVTPKAAPLVFALTFTTDAPPESIFVQARNEEGHEDWVHLLDANGQRLWMQPICPNCGISLPKVLEVPDGSQGIRFLWDGLLYPGYDCGLSDCAVGRVPDPGVYLAEFCYGFQATGVGDGETVLDPICVSQKIELPDPDGLVEYNVCACG